jgi:hypothetical protein
MSDRDEIIEAMANAWFDRRFLVRWSEPSEELRQEYRKDAAVVLDAVLALPPSEPSGLPPVTLADEWRPHPVMHRWCYFIGKART